MEVTSTAKWVRTTARKARLVANVVEGQRVSDALTVLSFMPRHVARDVAKVIKSAAANAEHNYSLDADALRVVRVTADTAGMIKRFRPKARGSVGSVFRRMSHLTAIVTDEVVEAPVRKARTEPVATTESAPETVQPSTKTTSARRPPRKTSGTTQHKPVTTDEKGEDDGSES